MGCRRARAPASLDVHALFSLMLPSLCTLTLMLDKRFARAGGVTLAGGALLGAPLLTSGAVHAADATGSSGGSYFGMADDLYGDPFEYRVIKRR